MESMEKEKHEHPLAHEGHDEPHEDCSECEIVETAEGPYIALASPTSDGPVPDEPDTVFLMVLGESGVFCPEGCPYPKAPCGAPMCDAGRPCPHFDSVYIPPYQPYIPPWAETPPVDWLPIISYNVQSIGQDGNIMHSWSNYVTEDVKMSGVSNITEEVNLDG